MKQLKTRRWLSVLVLTWSVACGAATSPDVPSSPSLAAALRSKTPTALLPSDLAPSMTFHNNAGASPPSTATWSTSNNGTKVLRVESFNRAKSADQLTVRWDLNVPANSGDAVLVRFMARAEYARQESGDAMIELRVAQTQPSHSTHVRVPLTAGPAWTLLEVPFTQSQDAAPGQTTLQLALGGLIQAVEIANLEVLNFGKSAKTSELPATRFTYSGREATAPWRDEALARIEKIRTAPIELRVIDAAGKPVPKAEVKVRLVQPAFIFGTEVDAGLLLADTPDAKKHRDNLLALFDTAVLGNAMKWPSWGSSPAKRAQALQASDWIDANKLRQRGHNLVWPGNQFSPKHIVNMPAPKAELPLLIKEHIRDILTANKGRMVAWDVINEMTHERDYFKYMPELEAAEWFKLARELDPGAQLFINEYGMLNSPNSPNKIAEYVTLIHRLRAAGAPIDAIGVQGHVGRQPRNPVDVLKDLDLLSKAGLPVQITEFDINSPDEELQGDYTRDFLIALYSHPSVTGFTMWGFWQSKHWKPDGAMFRTDWSEKPNAKVWRDLVRNQWLTKVATTTDAQGKVNTRGHLGEYEFTVTAGQKTLVQRRTLTQTGVSATLQFP